MRLGGLNPRVKRTSGRGEAGPKGKVEQERMQVCLNEYLCRCLRLWQVQWRRAVSGLTGALNGHDSKTCKAFHIGEADRLLDKARTARESVAYL